MKVVFNKISERIDIINCVYSKEDVDIDIRLSAKQKLEEAIWGCIYLELLNSNEAYELKNRIEI